MSIKLFHNYINEPGHNDNVRSASDKHNLRVDPDNPNVIHSLTKNNILVIDGKRVTPTNSAENNNTVQSLTDSLKSDFIKSANTNAEGTSLSDQEKSKLQTERTKFKSKVKKWSENEKSDPDEKQFWSELHSKIGNEELNGEDLSNELKSFGKSVKRFNNKKKALANSSNFNSLIGTSSRNINMSIISKELVFKIPDQYEKNIKPIDFFNICRKTTNHLYPNHKAIYETVHADENPDNAHYHCRLSGKNKETKMFDIQTSLVNRVSELNPELNLKGRKYSSLNEDELKIFGEAYQTEVYKVFNSQLKKKGYDFKVEKRTKEEKKNDFREFIDKKRPIANREYNSQKKLKVENNKISQTIEKKNDVINAQNDVIELKNEEIKELKKEVTVWQKVVESAKKALTSAFNFAKTNQEPELDRYYEEQELLQELSSKTSQNVQNQAESFQPNEDQRKRIKRPSNRR